MANPVFYDEKKWPKDYPGAMDIGRTVNEVLNEIGVLYKANEVKVEQGKAARRGVAATEPVPDILSGPAKIITGLPGAAVTTIGKTIQQIPAGVGKLIGAVPRTPIDYGANPSLEFAGQGVKETIKGVRDIGAGIRKGVMSGLDLVEKPAEPSLFGGGSPTKTGVSESWTPTLLPETKDLIAKDKAVATSPTVPTVATVPTVPTATAVPQGVYKIQRRKGKTPLAYGRGVPLTPEQEEANTTSRTQLANEASTADQIANIDSKIGEVAKATFHKGYGVARKDQKYVADLMKLRNELVTGTLGLEGTKATATERALATKEAGKSREMIAEENRNVKTEAAKQKANESYLKRHIITDQNPETKGLEPNDTLTFLRMGASSEPVPDIYKDDVSREISKFESFYKRGLKGKGTPEDRELAWRVYWKKFRRYPQETIER